MKSVIVYTHTEKYVVSLPRKDFREVGGDVSQLLLHPHSGNEYILFC